MEFNDWAQLFKDDPRAFEKRKQEALDAELDKMLANGKPIEEVNRLRAVLWRQEQELNKYKDPTARYNKVVELFYEQHAEFNKAVLELQYVVEKLK